MLDKPSISKSELPFPASSDTIPAAQAQDQHEKWSAENNNPGATRLLPETEWMQETLPSGTPPEQTIVVTVARQFGSNGTEIAQQVASQMGLRYLDKTIIDETIQALYPGTLKTTQALPTPTPAPVKGMVGQILAAIQASSPFTNAYQSFLQPASSQQPSSELTNLRLSQKIMLEMATQGNVVIVDRGAQFLLHNAPRTLHISIFAPMSYRVDTICRQFQLSCSSATLLIEKRDYEQSSYLHRYYGNNGEQNSLYHLLINTGLLSPALAVNFICQSLPFFKNATSAS